MAASTITRDIVTNDTGTVAVPVGDGTIFNADFYNNFVMARIDQMFAGAGAYATFTLGGALVVEKFGAHRFTAAGTGGNTLSLWNTTAGTTNHAGFYLGNDSEEGAAQFVLTASSYTTNAPYYQDGLTVQSKRVGGMNVAATHASGVIRFTTGGNSEKARFTTTGGLAIGDTTDPGAGALRLRVAASNAGLTVTDGTVIGVLFASSIPGLAIGTQSNHPLYFGTNNAFPQMALNTSGQLFIGSTVGANAFVTVGLTINQGSNDDHVLSFQSSDIAHGMTLSATADTYADFCKTHPTAGGGTFRGFSTTTGAGLTMLGCQATPDTAKTSAANAAVIINGGAQSGTGITTLGTNGNILAVRDNGVTRVIFDAEGDAHQDATTNWTNYDTEDDAAVLNLLAAHVTRRDDPLRASFGAWLAQSRDPLERLRLVNFEEPGHAWVDMSKLAMLHTGAIRQLASALASTRLELQAVQRQLEG